jgi:transcription initiation factor TFIID subunit 2
VVIKVWYAAGPAAGDALPDATVGMSDIPGSGTRGGWSVPGAGALRSCAEEDGGRFLAAPGAAARPAAWFPCVDDGASLAHFSLGVTVERGLVAVAPGILTKTAEEEEAEEGAEEDRRGSGADAPSSRGAPDVFDPASARSGPKKKRFAFSSGGVPTQAHTITLAVGDFAQKAIPVSAAAVSAFTAAAEAEARDAEREREKKARETTETESSRGLLREGVRVSENTNPGRGNTNDADPNDPNADVSSTRRSATHTLYVPRGFEMELDAASSAVASALREVELYLGRAFPFPGGARFAFVPSDCATGAGSRAPGVAGGVNGDIASALIGCGVVVLPIDALAHPRSATCVLRSRTVLAECAARLVFGGFLEPAGDGDAWLAEGLAGHLAGRCVVARAMGGDELRYRRAREAEAVIAADDGNFLPPLASREARVWRGGRSVGGAPGDENEAGPAKTPPDAPQPPRVGAETERRAVPVSRPPRPLAPEVERLVRAKATAVIGMLERKLGEEGMRKVLRKLAGLQAKSPGAEALQERASAAAKATRAAREKAKAAAEAASQTSETTDEAANVSAKEKAAQCARDLLRREREEAKASHALAASPARFLRSVSFLTLCRQNATMTKNEMAAFFCRWIEGGGCPRLTVGYTFRKSRRQELLFAIELDGCAAAAAADRAAFRKNAKISVTVRVQEADLPPSDHAVSLSAHDRAYCLMPLQLVTKPKDRRTIARQQQAALDRQQRAIEEGGANPRSLDAAAAAEVLQWECPVQWVRVDPEGEWLAEVRVPVAQHGLEGMVTAQLTKERPADVAAQAAAVAYLSKRAAAGSTSATRALLQCAGDETVFCRVRSDAAVALSSSARDGTQRANLAHTGVARAYRKRLCDPESGLPLPSALGGASSLADAVVDEGFLRALGAPREPVRERSRRPEATSPCERWHTPLECVELLIDALNHFRADGDPMDGSSFVAAALTSLGRTRPPTAASFAGAANAVARWARRDAAVCGAGGAAHAGGRRVTVAAIHALKHLLCAGGGEAFAKEKAAGDAHANANEKPPISPFGSALRFAREISADAAGDPCRAVRRAGASLAFALEWRWGGRTGPARALALAALACKAEPSAGARADVLWDARTRFARAGGRARRRRRGRKPRARPLTAARSRTGPPTRSGRRHGSPGPRRAARRRRCCTRSPGARDGTTPSTRRRARAAPPTSRRRWRAPAAPATPRRRRSRRVRGAWRRLARSTTRRSARSGASARRRGAGPRRRRRSGAGSATKDGRRVAPSTKRRWRRRRRRRVPSPPGPSLPGPSPPASRYRRGPSPGPAWRGRTGGLPAPCRKGRLSRTTLARRSPAGPAAGPAAAAAAAEAAAATMRWFSPAPPPRRVPVPVPVPTRIRTRRPLRRSPRSPRSPRRPPRWRPRSRRRVDRKTATMTKPRRLRRHRPSLLRPRPRTRRRGWARSASGLRRRRLRPRRRRTPWRR